MLALGLALAPACGGNGKDGSTGPEAEEEAEPVPEEGKDWGGWRWKGRRQDCFFVYKNRCFAELEKACRAARCEKKGKECVKDDAAPANVSCKGE